jgi:hypothetical protein
MTINRRTAIRQLAFLSASAALLPSCLGDHSKPDLVLNNFTVKDAGQRTLDALTATLIPTTDTPGARETGASLFILKMLDDCSSKTDQDKFFKGMKALDDASRKRTGAPFVAATGAQREAILTAIGEKKIPGDELNFFYSTARKADDPFLLLLAIFPDQSAGIRIGARPLAWLCTGYRSHRNRIHRTSKLILMGDSTGNNRYDAIVIGSGMSGGWAAKEFTERGFKTLVLERGREVRHIKDYPTTNMLPWEFEHRGEIPYQVREANPSVSRCYAFREDAMHFFVKDTDHPYVKERPFDWIRGYQVGGKSLLWARQTQRWSDFDFEGPTRDGYATDWPIRYKDLASWYSYVEKFVGISGNRDGLPQLPDGEFLPPLELSCVETYFADLVRKTYKDRPVIYGRCAHLTEPTALHLQQGRGQCQNRNLCQRGCPFGGYYNSNSTTIPWAEKTGQPYFTALLRCAFHPL